MTSECGESYSVAAWQYEPLVVRVYAKSMNKPSLLLQLAPVFFNPLYQLDCDQNQKKKAFAESSQKQTTVKHVLDHSVSKQPSESDGKKWRNDAEDLYLQRKRKRVVSAYMDNHKIGSLLRTFEIMSRSREDSASTPVAISWLSAAQGEGGGGYVGIVNARGDVEVNQKHAIGMVKIVVDQHQDVVMLRSSTLDCYLTGHSDTGVVDGRANSTDVTACHWKVVAYSRAFQDSTPSEYVLLQYWGKRHYKSSSFQDDLFFVIKNNKFRLENFSFVREYGVFRLH